MHKVSDNPYQVSDSMFIEFMSEDVDKINQVFVNIKIGNRNVPIIFKLDTGALVTSFPYTIFTNLSVMIWRARRKGCLAMVAKARSSLKAGLHCDISISTSINKSITNVHTCA